MKSIHRNIVAAAAAVLTLLGSASISRAVEVVLDGYGYYKLGTKVDYLGTGTDQSGRYANLGADYYHKTVIGVQWITNKSNKNSGELSFEFWGMPYYGATKGIVLMTRSAQPLKAHRYYNDPEWTGWGIFLDEWRFPELNLWEYTKKGWKWRDALSFKKGNLL